MRGMPVARIARQLFSLARRRWLKEENVVDDISVVIVRLCWPQGSATKPPSPPSS